VKCPSEKDGHDHGTPEDQAIRNCLEHLRAELECAAPDRILALGGVPFQSLSELFRLDDAPEKVEDFHGRVWWVRIGAREVPLSGTYFAGTKRHTHFDDIPTDIDRLLSLQPRQV